MVSAETVIILSVLVLASLEDLHIREVPDVLSYFFIGAGVLFSVHEAVLASSVVPVFSSLGGIVGSFVFGLVLMHAQMWGGGDTKLLMGLGAFMGVWPGFTDLPVLVFLIFMAGSLYGLVWTTVLIASRWKELQERDGSFIQICLNAFIVFLAVEALVLVFSTGMMRVVLSLSALLLTLTGFTAIILRRLEDVLVIKRVSTERLVPGDWLIEGVDTKFGRVEPRSVGLSEEDVGWLKESDVRHVYVKYGLPFIPSFLFGYVLFLVITSVGVV